MRCRCCCCCKDRRRRNSRTSSSGESESAVSEEDDDFWEHYEQREFDSFAFPPGVLCPAMICCSMPPSERDEEEVAPGAPSFPRRGRLDQKNCWDSADGAGIKVRGPGYLQDRKKCESKSPMLVLDGAQLLRGRDLESYSNSSKCCFRGNGFSLILNFRLPDVQLVISWSVAEAADWLDTPQGLQFRRFVYEMSAEDRSRRLKLIARVLEGSFMLKQAVGSKPAIIGNQCSIQYFRHQDSLEASMDMGDSSIGRRLRGLLDGSSVLELFILLEGLNPAELPERLLGGLTLCRVDVASMVWASSTRLERASWHYVLYPTVLLGLTVALLLRPSSICRCKWKLQLLRGIGRTCLAPFYFVNFGDNMVGDVLTSLARPLRDVPAAFCYLSSHHPQLRSSMERFVNSGNTCPAWEHLIVSPLIAALPFWFRLLQCARRFYDTGQKRHLLNLGKYASSLMVVVVSSPGWPIWAVVVASAIATVYAAWWDVCMDWGLTYTELCFLTRSAGGGSRYGSPMHSPAGPGLPPSPAQSAQSFHSVTFRQQPGGHASRQSVGQYTRHFSARVYCLAVLGDLVLRCTWVITLMPITLLGKGVVWREILHVFMTVAEIFRRSFWAILRIEYEQVANASGYRALLWVPMKVGQKVGGDASAHGFRQSLLPG